MRTTDETRAATPGAPAAAAATPRPTAPRIAVRLFAGAAAAFGADAAEVQAGTLDEAVRALLADASEEGRRVIDRSSFLVNAVARTDRAQTLGEGDRVDVLPPFAGG